MKTKFNLGDTIKHVNDPDIDAGKIIHVSVNDDRVMYTIAIKDWNPEKRQVIDAVKHIEESEAEEVKANE